MRKSITVGLPYIDVSSPDQSPDVTMTQLKLELLRNDARALVGSKQPPKFSPGTFFGKVIEMEDRRQVLLLAVYYLRLHTYSGIHSV